jgi:hypothetical protein
VQSSDSICISGGHGLSESLLYGDATDVITTITTMTKCEASDSSNRVIIEGCRACKFWQTNMPKEDVYQSTKECCLWPFAKCSGEGGVTI